MNTLLMILILLLMGAGAAALVWWLFFETEGVYLGRRVVIWLYDRYADRYDSIKQFQPQYEYWLLAKPLMEEVAPETAPLVLDVAVGTGRLPEALLSHTLFDGYIVGIDLSRRMLARAAAKLARAQPARLALIWTDAAKLPFADDLFDVVTCLEALEFMDNPAAVVQELVRVLRPGGLLLATTRINTRWMPGKLWRDDDLYALMDGMGMETAALEPWQADYHKLWATKGGDSAFTGGRPLETFLRCPACQNALMHPDGALWVCERCGQGAPVGADGVIELAALKPDARRTPPNTAKVAREDQSLVQ